MEMHFYVEGYRPEDRERAAEVSECLSNNMELSILDRVFVFSRDPLHSDMQQRERVTAIVTSERLTFARWLREAEQRSIGAIAILANADIALTDSIEYLRDIFRGNSPSTAFIALTRYEETSRGLELHPSPFWSQDLWALCPGLSGLPTAFLQQTAFPLGVPGCDNVFAWMAYCHGYVLHNPCLQVVTRHRHRAPTRSYHFTRDRLLGNYCFVRPAKSVGAPSQLEFEMLVRSEQPITGLMVFNYDGERDRLLGELHLTLSVES